VNGLFWHTIASEPAYTVTCREILKTTDPTAAEHPESPFAVSVRVTLPAAISAALGIYVGLRIVVLSKFPVPERVQSKDDSLAAVAAERIKLLPSQITEGGPALATAAGFTVSINWLVAFPQGKFPYAVSVSVTDPVSPTPGW
jgi:hypothetical protein